MIKTLAVAALVLATAAPASAQVRAVRLEPPECASLPFTHERLSDLLAVELAVHRMALVRGEEADAVVAYDAVDCARASAIEIEIEHADGTFESIEVDSARAREIALLVAELLRARSRAEPRQENLVMLASDTTTSPAEPAHAAGALGRPRQPMLRAPTRERETPRPRTMADVSLFAGAFAAELLYNPQLELWLFGLRSDLGFRIAPIRELRLHIDAGFAMGSTSNDVAIGTVSTAFWIGVAAGGPDFSIELGPRLQLSYGWQAQLPVTLDYRGEAILLALSGVVRGALRVFEGLSVILDLEVGANVAGSINFLMLTTGAGGIQNPFVMVRFGAMID